MFSSRIGMDRHPGIGSGRSGTARPRSVPYASRRARSIGPFRLHPAVVPIQYKRRAREGRAVIPRRRPPPSPSLTRVDLCRRVRGAGGRRPARRTALATATECLPLRGEGQFVASRVAGAGGPDRPGDPGAVAGEAGGLCSSEARILFGGRRGRPQRVVQLVFPDLPQQGARADPQELGGPLPVAPGLDQALLDRLALQIGQRDPRAVTRSPSRSTRSRGCSGAVRRAGRPGAGPCRWP